MTALAHAWKAVVAFLVPGAAVLLADALGDEPITGRTLLVAGLTALVTSGGVYVARNEPT